MVPLREVELRVTFRATSAIPRAWTNAIVMKDIIACAQI